MSGSLNLFYGPAVSENNAKVHFCIISHTKTYCNMTIFKPFEFGLMAVLYCFFCYVLYACGGT